MLRSIPGAADVSTEQVTGQPVLQIEVDRAAIARHGIAAVDLTDGFAAAVGRGDEIYYPIDQHLTPAGYRRMAEQVAEALGRASAGAGWE